MLKNTKKHKKTHKKEDFVHFKQITLKKIETR